MRIATQMLHQQALRALQVRQAALARAQREATTGLRVATASDDPLDAARLMALSGQLHDVDQFRRNGVSASVRLAVEDGVITAVRQLVAQAQGLALSSATPSSGDPLRLAALDAVQQLREQVVGLANSRVGEEYVFGGARTTTPPFLASGAYAGDSTVRQAEIDDGVRLDTVHPGDAVFSDALQALEALIQELQIGTPASIRAVVPALEQGAQTLLQRQAEVGARLGHIRETSNDLARRTAQLLEERDSVRSADPAVAAVQLVNAQAALERAYAAVGRVMATSLLDYLA
jgi:flagellar hook-associated protein 3 FlgL